MDEEKDLQERVALDVSREERSLIRSVLFFLCNERSVEDQLFVRQTDRPRRMLRTLLQRITEQIDREEFDRAWDFWATAFWVESVEFEERRGRTVLHGPDFGREMGWSTDEDEGTRLLFALRGDERLDLPEVRVVNVHRWNKGRAWEVAGSKYLPEPPFLLLDERGCHRIFRGDVGLRPTSWALGEIEQAVRVKSVVPVMGDMWFGVIRVDAGDYTRGYLEAFAREAVPPLRGDILVKWVDWDHEFGHVVFG